MDRKPVEWDSLIRLNAASADAMKFAVRNFVDRLRETHAHSARTARALTPDQPVADARGSGPNIIDVLARHPDWRARLIDVLTVNDPDRYREPPPAYVRVEQRRAARERERERRQVARARAIAERSRRAGDLWAADRARRLAARRAPR